VQLSDIRIRDFRCLVACDLSPSPGLNFIVGDNASGKSSILEALHFLGRGRSFRRTPNRDIVRKGADGFSVFARAGEADGRPRRMGVAYQRGGLRTKLDGQEGVPFVDLVNTLPIQIIDPNLHRLIEEGPRFRRHYLDWGVFHVEHEFFPAWRRFRRALKQRNRALREGLSKNRVVIWDSELVRAGREVDACRRSYLRGLELELPRLVARVLGGDTVSVEYRPGWSEADYGASLAGSLERDRRAGFTTQGPHRADLRVQVESVTARDWVSRGQQKVITSCLLLAQAALLDRRRDVRPVLLIDDIAAELGEAYRHALIDAIRELGCQCFITFLGSDLIPAVPEGAVMFHVEHGCVRRASGPAG